MTQRFGTFTYANKKGIYCGQSIDSSKQYILLNKEGFGPYLCGVNGSLINRKRFMEFRFLLTPLLVVNQM